MHWSFTLNTSCLQFWNSKLCFSVPLSSIHPREETLPLNTQVWANAIPYFLYVFFATMFCYTGIFWNLEFLLKPQFCIFLTLLFCLIYTYKTEKFSGSYEDYTIKKYFNSLSYLTLFFLFSTFYSIIIILPLYSWNVADSA